MASYFYLMSSLPMLKSGEQMPIEYDKFLSYCNGFVSDKKFEELKNLTLNSSNSPLLKKWSAFYKSYLDELTYQRSKKLQINANQSYDKDGEASKIIALAMADKNPLTAEETLLSFLFDKLDSLVGTHTFDDTALFGYALKLKLLERSTVFNQKRGKNELNRLVKDLQEKIESIN